MNARTAADPDVSTVRERMPTTMDGWSYREKHDAARTLDASSARLRDRVDLDSVRADLFAAVQGTVPARVRQLLVAASGAAFARLWRALGPAFPCISVAYAMKTAAVPTLALLPNEVELDAVRADLLEVVQEPMHPDHASLWLRRT